MLLVCVTCLFYGSFFFLSAALLFALRLVDVPCVLFCFVGGCSPLCVVWCFCVMRCCVLLVVCCVIVVSVFVCFVFARYTVCFFVGVGCTIRILLFVFFVCFMSRRFAMCVRLLRC